MMHRTFALGSIGFALPLLAATDALATAQRTFVSSTGNDAANCQLATPCRSFGAAIAKTLSGGEVIVLDSAGYGVVSINQSVSIVAPSGIYAGISVLGSTNGIYINTGDVTLRGLTINGESASSLSGVFVFDGGIVNIERCEISNMAAWGVEIAPGIGTPTVNVSNSVIRHNISGGIALRQGDSTRLCVTDTAVSGGFYGVWVAAGFAFARDTVASQNVAAGFAVTGELGHFAQLTCERCSSIGNGTGFRVDGTEAEVLLSISKSLASQNGDHGMEAIKAPIIVTESTSTLNRHCGFHTQNGQIYSAGNNFVFDNSSGDTCGSELGEVGTI